MESFLIYIGKSAIAAGAFYMVFLLLFQNQKHFVFNRVYLPVSLALSFVIPLITFTTVKYIEPTPALGLNSFGWLADSNEFQPPAFDWEWYHYLFGIYLLGAAGFLFQLLLGHLKAIHIIRKSRIQKLFENLVNITPKDVHPFSFFNKIVLSEKTLSHPNLDIIVSHENIHVREKHTLDILFTEIMFLFQWFNPFAWLLKDAVKNNLEYKTDHEIAKTSNPQTYQMDMVTLADKEGIAPFLTALNGSQLKNRIIMMKKKTENKYALLKQLVVLPLLAILVMGLSNKEVKTQILKSDAEKIQSAQSANNSRFNLNAIAKPGEIEAVDNDDTSKKESQPGGFVISDGLNETMQKRNEKDTITPSAQNGIKIRTTGNQTKQPLYVVDGVETTNIDQIPPENIAQIDVLKNESSTALYGERGKNGVILITTKKAVENGKNEKLYIVDGKEINYAQMQTISPDQIASISVLKDKSATDLYGERAKNGAIIITTKGSSVPPKGELPIVLNGKMTELTLNEVDQDLIKNIKRVEPVEAVKKYGEKAENGVFEVTSRNVYTDKVKVKSSDEITTPLELRKFIATKIKYPVEAQKNNITGTVKLWAVVEYDGEITHIYEKEPKGNIEKLDEVVVVAYSTPNPKSSGTNNEAISHVQNAGNDNNTSSDLTSLLTNEVKRVLSAVPAIDLPELQGKTVEITVKFMLQ